jgi:hypothetical protein
MMKSIIQQLFQEAAGKEYDWHDVFPGISRKNPFFRGFVSLREKPWHVYRNNNVRIK